MSVKFTVLTRNAVRGLKAGECLREHGIVATRLANGDVAYRVNIMVDGERIHRAIGKERDGITREQAERAIEVLRTKAREARLDLPTGRKVIFSFDDAARMYVERLTLEGGRSIERKEQHLRSRLVPFLVDRRGKGTPVAG